MLCVLQYGISGVANALWFAISYFSLVEISQNVTTLFATTCDLWSFVTKFGSIYNCKIKFQLFWSLLRL